MNRASTSNAAVQELLVERLNAKDLQGNTPLHHVVATHNLQDILFFAGAPEVDKRPKNNQGETAADWFREYFTSSISLKNISQLDNLPQKIKEGHSDYVEDCLKLGVSRKLRYYQGDTLLHLAARYSQEAIVKLLLQGISDGEKIQLLELKNAQGKNPEELIKTVEHSDPTRQTILKYLKEQYETAKQVLNTPEQKNVFPLLLTIENNEIVLFHKTLSQIRQENDFHKIQPFLSVLCCITNLTCQQAIQLLNSESSSLTEYQITRSELLLKMSFGKFFHRQDTASLCAEIIKISNYLNEIITKNIVHQKIKLSASEPSLSGWTYLCKGIIYINPLQANDLPKIVGTLIHEASHVIINTHDFSYHPVSCSNQQYLISFSSTDLLNTGKSPKIPEEKQPLLSTLQLLTAPADQSRLYQWMAFKNADTFSAVTIGAAAIYQGSADISGDILSIHTEKFLADLQQSPLSPPPSCRAIKLARRIREMPDDRSPEKLPQRIAAIDLDDPQSVSFGPTEAVPPKHVDRLTSPNPQLTPP